MRLIDADELLKPVGSYNPIKYTYEYGEVVTVEDIKRMPTVDAERHGHWISDRLCSTNGGTYGVKRCSNCEYYYNDFGDEWNYCPDCGAKMDEVEETKKTDRVLMAKRKSG